MAPAHARTRLLPVVTAIPLQHAGPASAPRPGRPRSEPEPHTMRCFEVWGGNHAVDQGVVMPGLDAWLHSRPFHGDQAGGDIHYVSSCAAGLLTRVLIADVSGHGSRVAGVSGALRDLMRRYVNFVDQTRLVGALNERFAELADDATFATAVVATYLAPERRLTLSSAGHPTPLHYNARTRTWSLLRQGTRPPTDGPANIPLGVAEPTRYDQVDVVLGDGDLVVLYTDALIEAPAGGQASGQPSAQTDGPPDAFRSIGEEGLRRIAAELDTGEPADLLRALLQHVFPHDDAPDDVTILVMRRNSLVPRAGLAKLVLSELRLLPRLVRGILARDPDTPWPDTGPFALLRKRRSPSRTSPHPKTT